VAIPLEYRIKMNNQYYVYILTNQRNTVLYTGFSNNVAVRTYKHKEKIFKNSFSARYNLNKLVYYEYTDNVEGAIMREKQIKAGSRKKRSN
jgi:putative endonuclease